MELNSLAAAETVGCAVVGEDLVYAFSQPLHPPPNQYGARHPPSKVSDYMIIWFFPAKPWSKMGS